MLKSLSWRAEHHPEQRRLVAEHKAALASGDVEGACAQGERLLDLDPFAEGLEALAEPLDPGLSAWQLYALLGKLEVGAGSEPWRSYLRVVVLDRLGWWERAFGESSALVDVAGRYGWMRLYRGLRLMTEHAYEEAVRELEAALRGTPRLWRAAACRAECLLCTGREDEALAALDALVAELPGQGQPQDFDTARVWRGEALLWVGRYEEALGDVEEAAGHRLPHALVCRGAARAQLGALEEAVADLDAAQSVGPGIADAWIWRGEVRARQGRWEEAAADFDRALSLGAAQVWPHLGRALLRARGGDEPGFWEDFERLPEGVRRFFEWRLRRPVEGSLANRRRSRDKAAAEAVLVAAREAARGLRRSEAYLWPMLFHSREGQGKARVGADNPSVPRKSDSGGVL